eukprot:TRINITY_DN59710_c0_g1_i1.p1 TRINITY_DN59710_c0_g1~~TRINITY_DN59710_c0_g1_i1.p1  ORF type:complete len:896 (-),score=116.58 TRINITY_DN59710_c0_g1_i1:129-2816(-)
MAVQWYSWGDAAFQAAKQTNKVIFMTVGYSTCHWCHVMERESFSDPNTAQILNNSFINIKVDREERPDIDRFYMTFLHLTTGHGGWPMTLFLTPDLKPFYGATYIPAKDSPHGQGFTSLCMSIAQRWQQAPQEMLATADDVVAKLQQSVAAGQQEAPKPAELEEFFSKSNADRHILKCLDDFESSFDTRLGGFSAKPKFPTPCNFTFFAHAHCRLIERVRAAAQKFTPGSEGGDGQDPEIINPPAEPELPMGNPNQEVDDAAMEKAMDMRGQAQAAFGTDPNQAVQIITQAIQLNPSSGILYAVRADFLLKQNKPLSAIRDCDEAIKMNPNSAKPHKVRGKAKAQLRRWEEAYSDLAKANQFDYDDDTYALLKQLETDKKAAESRRKEKEDRERQHKQLAVTDAKGTHCLHMMMFTLHCISQGGIHDHLGGGFSRYSVDEFWHVPHFEKMLYDNAQLVCAYILAVQVDRRALYEKCVKDTLTYIKRDMCSADGAFASAEDSDSAVPGQQIPKEGAFYIWTTDEVRQLLTEHPKMAQVAMTAFGLTDQGNVRPCSDPHGELRGKNVLYLDKPVEQIAQQNGLSPDEVLRLVDRSKEILYKARSTRARPFRDDKVVTAWNGLTISAFARAHQVLGEDDYITTARKAITFVRRSLYNDETSTLYRFFRDGQAGTVPGLHSDYAFFIQGLLDSYVSTGNPEMLRWAETLQRRVEELFSDGGSGAFFDGAQDPSILIRMKEDHDGAEPAPNSVTVMNLWRLGNMLQNEEYIKRGRRALVGAKKQMIQVPRSTTYLLSGLDLYSQSCVQFAVSGETTDPNVQQLLSAIHSRLITRKVIVWNKPGHEVFAGAEYLKSVAGGPAVYVFEDWVQKRVCTTADQMEQALVDLNLAWPKSAGEQAR